MMALYIDPIKMSERDKHLIRAPGYSVNLELDPKWNQLSVVLLADMELHKLLGFV